jgi:hypothetical protein
LNRLASAAIFAALFLTTATSAYAAHSTPLAAIASRLGFEYSYLGPEDAVALTKPGVTIVIRPGERLFDVNDRTEAMEGPPPRFYLSDVYVSDSLFARLKAIGSRYPAAYEGHGLVVGRGAGGYGNVTGSIGFLKLGQVPGKQELAVGGKAPANLPITLTLVATFSSEVPDVILSRHLVTSDSDGTFQADVSIAPGYFTGAILTLVASSVPGIVPAKSQVVLTPPNGMVAVPADQVPRSVR